MNSKTLGGRDFGHAMSIFGIEALLSVCQGRTGLDDPLVRLEPPSQQGCRPLLMSDL